MNISAEDRAELVALARSATAATVKGAALPSIINPCGLFAEALGCFVTLTNSGQLRGCVGTFKPSAPLSESIVEMGSAAARDGRFINNPISSAELNQLTVEVSILSPLAGTNEPEKLEIGTHGVYIVRGSNRGCFLPEVAADQGWNVEQFLDYCCTHKADLPPGAWKDTQTMVYLFTSEKFTD